MFNEQIDNGKVIERSRRERIDIEYRMSVIPVPFNGYGKELRGTFQKLVSKGLKFSLLNQLVRPIQYLSPINCKVN
jgi:hypothetical protein